MTESTDYDDKLSSDFCRVCRCEGTASKPLFYPCMCTGSIKYIHQECLVRWLEYSKRHTCELCNHRFKFTPIYASGTPKFLPPKVLLSGLLASLRRLIFNWFHLTIVCFAWLIVVPLTACRIYRCLFTGSVSSLLTLPLNMLSTRHLLVDCIQGFTIVILALAAFLGYVSLRGQLLHGGGPAWLERDARAGHDGEARDAAEGNGHPFFPDFFNIFGMGNGVGLGAGVFGEPNDEDIVENPVHNDEPNSQTTSPNEAVVAFSSNSLNGTENLDTQASYTVDFQQSSSGTVRVENSNSSSSTRSQQIVWQIEEQRNDLVENVDIQNAEQDTNGPNDADDIGEAMNWEHLLGLDGSFSFLEHVLWLIALNTVFIVIFAFCPYHMGQFTVLGFKLDKFINATHMEGFSTSLIGYLIFACALVLMHEVFALLQMPRACYWTGLGYVYIKVALVSLLELGIFPVLCGFWIDACTLNLFNATVSQRVSVFHYAPLAFTFIHWATGILYIFYMASLFVLGRTVLRPGLLRFIYHFNDPDIKPIQDMILQPLPVYLQRLVVTYCIWGILIVLTLWMPTEGIRRISTNFLPFRITIAYDSPLDYSMKIILLQVVLPLILDVQAKSGLRELLKYWCIGVAWLLNLRSYLLGDVPFKLGDYIVTEDGRDIPYVPPDHHQNDEPTVETRFMKPEFVPTPSSPSDDRSHLASPIQSDVTSSSNTLVELNVTSNPGENNNIGSGNPEGDDDNVDDDEANLDGDDDMLGRYVPYKRPSYFQLRIAGLIVILLISLIILSTVLLIVPVGIGRFTLKLISNNSTPKHDATALISGFTILGLLLRLSTVLPSFIKTVWQYVVLVIWQSGQLLCWSKQLRVLRVWTRWGTTCEITIRRPALPAPMSSLRANQNINILTDLQIRHNLFKFTHIICNYLRLLCVAVIILIILPIAIGLLIDLTFVVPFRVGSCKTLIIGFWEHWIFGILHLKVAVLLILDGPTWWVRNRLEQFQNEIFQNRLEARALRLLSISAPLIVGVTMSLSVPYLIAYYSGPLLALDPEFAFRYVYPCLFIIFLALVLIAFSIYQLRRLYVHIKDEKYLIGRKLVNFRPSSSNSIISAQNST